MATAAVSIPQSPTDSIRSLWAKLPRQDQLKLLRSFALDFSFSTGCDKIEEGISMIAVDCAQEEGFEGDYPEEDYLADGIPTLRPITVWPVALTAPEFINGGVLL